MFTETGTDTIDIVIDGIHRYRNSIFVNKLGMYNTTITK